MLGYEPVQYLKDSDFWRSRVHPEDLPEVEAGASKPGRRIFEIAIARLGLEPARTFFIDDLLPNIETARALGFICHHYHHEKHAALLGALQARGILTRT